MKILVTASAHMIRSQAGEYYVPSIYSDDFFARYLNVFEEIRFVAKVRYQNEIDEKKYHKLSNNRVEIFELPWYQGLKGLIQQGLKLFIKLRKIGYGCDAYVFRIAQIESYLAFLALKKTNRPYSVEVVNDPDTFDLKGILKSINMFVFKKMISGANGVSYVTEKFLQEKYPSSAKIYGQSERYFESYYSSVELNKEDLHEPKKYGKINRLRMVHVSNAINNNIKGHKTLIDIVKYMIDEGYDVAAYCIGEGTAVSDFIAYSKELGVHEKVNFVGRIHDRREIFEFLHDMDIFVLPTYMEGLPRSIIEAQAAGLPCLSSPIAGVPELIGREYLFDQEDVVGFSSKLISLINNPRELEDMSETNVDNARKYIKEILETKRTTFYTKLKMLVIKE